MYTDPIADMLNRIRNAQAVEKQTVDVPFSLIKYNIAQCLEGEGFIGQVVKKKKEKRRFLNITLKYDTDGTSLITEIKRVSTPGQRIYKQKKELEKVKGGRGVSIISTPKGIMTNNEARKKGLGGEVLCEVW
jgi:small subunit ribosomal protein S8